jgi:AraC-like DNA-binding protein
MRAKSGKLLTALDEAVPSSLSEVARRLGYKDTERLYQADRKLCHMIAARYRQSGRSHWWRKPGAARICDAARLKEILERSLKSNRPTSVHRIAASLGYSNDGYVHRKYPELCREIGEKIALVKRARPDNIRSILEKALDEHPAPTLKDLSRRLRYSSSTVLRAHEPELCDQLAARHTTHVIKRRADLERIAIAALGETPVPSVRDLCKRLGITVWFMNRYFPVVRRLVAEQHRYCVSVETRRRRERLYRDVRSIAADLRSQNLYPSANRIVEHLTEGSCREWKALALAIREAHNALGISK